MESETCQTSGSMESGYGSVITPTNCDICENNCTEPIVVWFSKQRNYQGNQDMKNSLLGVGYLCSQCFEDSSINFVEKLRQRSKIQVYSSVNLDLPDSSAVHLQTKEEIPERKKRQGIRERMTCSVIGLIALLFVLAIVILLVILMLAGVLKSVDSSNGNSDTSMPQTQALSQNCLEGNFTDLQMKYETLLKEVKSLTSLTIKHRNEVDIVLSNHTLILADITSHINQTHFTTDDDSKVTAASQCSHYIPRQRTAAAASDTRTPWYPTSDDVQMLITGVECSGEDTEFSQLQTRQQNGLTQYSCFCPAQTNTGRSIHTCRIHIWSCTW